MNIMTVCYGKSDQLIVGYNYWDNDDSDWKY